MKSAKSHLATPNFMPIRQKTWRPVAESSGFLGFSETRGGTRQHSEACAEGCDKKTCCKLDAVDETTLILNATGLKRSKCLHKEMYGLGNAKRCGESGSVHKTNAEKEIEKFLRVQSISCPRQANDGN